MTETSKRHTTSSESGTVQAGRGRPLNILPELRSERRIVRSVSAAGLPNPAVRYPATG
ncbi:MAG: hypothetical protein IT324_08920 [Anaerolineae bacterium]|nr:hypothetical protein [Anaerolineae bacterium]